MSVSSIFGSSSQIANVQPTSVTANSFSAQDSDGDTTNSSGVSGATGGGQLAQAISQALSQLGVSAGSTASQTSSPSATTSTTQDPQQALAAFMQNLLAALQSQNGQSGATTGNDSSTTSATSSCHWCKRSEPSSPSWWRSGATGEWPSKSRSTIVVRRKHRFKCYWNKRCRVVVQRCEFCVERLAAEFQ